MENHRNLPCVVYILSGFMPSGNASPLSTEGSWCDCVEATLRCFLALSVPEQAILMLTRMPLLISVRKEEILSSYSPTSVSNVCKS